MDFSIQLSAYYPDKSYGGDRLYRDLLEQAVVADRTGFDAVSLTEHHLINILMMPAPLQFAVKIADATESVKIMTSVAVLPLHDMRSYAGEVVCADIFTEGRLMLGVGRGAFGFEMERLGVPIEISREKFDESLNVLMALLRDEEVSWDGTYYKFDALTIMPRPMTAGGPPIMMAVMVPEAIYHCTKRGFHIQTTPLSATTSTCSIRSMRSTAARRSWATTAGTSPCRCPGSPSSPGTGPTGVRRSKPPTSITAASTTSTPVRASSSTA